MVNAALASALAAGGIAALVWPGSPRGVLPAGRRSAPGRTRPARLVVSGGEPRTVRVIAGAAVGLVAAGVVALTSSWACGAAAALAAATAMHLVRRARSTTRRRREMGEAAAMLRRLARDLRAGTSVAEAATHAMAEAPRAVVGVLRDLPDATGAPGSIGLPDATGWGTGGLPSGPGGEVAEIRRQLRAGWQLSARHGIPLAAVVSSVADDLADRSSTADARAAQVAGPAVSGYVLAALPVAGLLLGAGVGADPIAVLTGAPIGSALLIVGTLLCCGGLLWADRLVRG